MLSVYTRHSVAKGENIVPFYYSIPAVVISHVEAISDFHAFPLLWRPLAHHHFQFPSLLPFNGDFSPSVTLTTHCKLIQ